MSNDQSRTQVQPVPQGKKASSGVLSRFLALEPRVLLDAAAAETAEKVVDTAAADAAGVADAGIDSVLSAFAGSDVVVSPLSGASGAREILFIDAGISGYENLIQKLDAGVEVHILQEGDWAAQVQAILGRRDGDVSAIHFVSHGGAGHLTLGGELVDLGNLDSYARAWSAMQNALTADGDLLLYGCDVAAGDSGAAFLQALSERTGADVAASVDLTGVARLGGNWNLEASTGQVDADSLYSGDAAFDFMGVLSDGWVQDAELTSGTSSVAMTHTTDGKDWKFVGTAGSNKVDIWVRNTSTGAWSLSATVTGGGSGSFGWDIAATGNKLAVSAPNFVISGTQVGRVYVYSYNGTNWTTTAVDVISCRDAAGSGENGNGTSDHGNDAFGYSIDLAWDGGTNYRLIIGNPNEDWWTMGTDGWGGSSQGNTRDNAGASFVYNATSHAGTFAYLGEMSSQNGGTNGNGHLFGSVVAAGYDVSGAKWWVASGGDGLLNQVWMYRNPSGTFNGGSTTTDGGTYTIQKLGWTSTGASQNDVSMDDDYMSIAGGTNIQFYKISGGVWAAGANLAVANAVVSIDDWDQSAAGDSAEGARVIFSYSGVAGIADINPGTGGQWIYWFNLSSRTETAVAIDRYYSIDMLTTNGTDVRSYHYNWDPTTTDNSATTDQNTTLSNINVTSNDTDTNITSYPSVPPTSPATSFYGDALSVTAVGASQYGATITFSGTNITYNPTGSTQLRQLAIGQSVVDTFTVTVSDGQGGSRVQNMSVTVNGLNDAPVVSQTPLTPFAIQQSGSTVTYEFASYFYDIDNGEDVQLVYDTTSLPAGWSAAASGTSLNITVPGSATAGDYTVTVRAWDPNLAPSTTNQNFIIRVDATNNAPVVAAPQADQVALATYAFSYTIPSTAFSDPDPAPYDTLSYSATLSSGAALPAWLSFDPSTRTFTGTPGAGDVGTITVRVTATDDAASRGRGANLSVTDDFILSVVNPSIRALTPFTDGPRAYGNFGFSTAISEDGNWLAVGAPGDDTDANGYADGSIWLYQWNGSGWTYVTGINGPAASAGSPGIPGSATGTSLTGNEFGWALDWSTDGTKLVVGARGTTNGQGSVYCYTRSGTTFTLNGILTAANPVPYDYFGSAVAINEGGTYVLIGAPGYDYDPDGTGTTYDPLYSDAGAAFMAAFPAANGVLTANVIPKDLASYDHFGSAVAFDQNLLVVSSPLDDNPSGITSLFKFEEASGTSASQTVGVSGGTINAYAQFAYDATRGQVLSLGLSTAQGGTSNGMMLMTTPIDIGSSWSVSTWYSGIESLSAQWRTLTRGSDTAGGGNHQIIVQAGSNLLGAYNNSGSGVIAGFNPIGSGEVQRVAVTSTGANDVGSFTLTLGGVTTGPITWHTTDATLAGRIQAALNTALGGSYVTVAVAAADAYSITFSAGGDLPQMTINTGGLTSPTSSVTTTTNGTNYALTAGQLTGWHNIIAVGEGGGTTYYIDGVKVGASLFKPTDDIYAVGNYQGGGQRFADMIDDFRIYDRALSWSEIRNIGVLKQSAVESAYSDVGSVYVFSTDAGNAQATKLYSTDGKANDQLGWAVDADVYDLGGTRMSATIVASSIFNDEEATDGGAVYVFNSNSLQTGAGDYGGTPGFGRWTQQAKITSYDSTSSDYFGSDVAYDYDETTGGSRLVVGAQFEDSNGAYSGAAYAYAYSLSANTFLPEKFVDAAPQGGSVSSSAFFGNSVALAYVDSAGGARTVFGARWRDAGQTNDGAVFWANLKATNYTWDTAASVSVTGSYFLPVNQSEIVNLDTSMTQGTVSFDTDGNLTYEAGDAFKTLGLGQTATDTFVYVTENAGISYVNTVTVTVYGQATLAAAADVVEVSAGSATLLNVLANDSDPVNGAATLSILAASGDDLQGRVYNTGTALIYDPRGRFDALRAGETVQETFTYIVMNADGQQVAASVTLLVVGVDDPVVAADDSVTVKADGSVTVDLLGNDSDADGAGTFRLESVDDSAALGSLIVNGDGTVTYVPGAAFRTLKAGETAVDRFVYTVIDDTGNRSSALVSVLVIGVNDAPAAANDLVAAVSGGTVAIDALANDADPDGDTMRITRLITDDTRGEVALNADGTISYTGPADLLTDSFRYEITDSLGQTSIATVYVNWPADPSVTPIVTGAVDDVAVTRGMEPVAIPVMENDSSRFVTSIDIGTGSSGSVTVDGTNLLYTPNASLERLAAGSVFVDTFSYAVQYTDGSMSMATVRVYVNGTYVAPITLEDEEGRFALVHGADTAVATPFVAAEAPRATADAHFAPPQDTAAKAALDGMVELSEQAEAPADVPVDAAPAAPVDAAPAAPAAQPEAASAAIAPASKPGLAALLSKEAQAKRAGVDSLVRHLSSNAA